MLLIEKALVKKIKYIADHFKDWPIHDKFEKIKFIWFATYDEPDLSYEFNMSRFGISEEGKFIWVGTSGCSCPSPWEEGLDTANWFELNDEIKFNSEDGHYISDDWKEILSKTVDNIYLAIKSPDKLDVQKILQEENVEVRRVLIEKLGNDKFIKRVNPEILDESETGRLLKVELKGDEDMVLLEVKDASSPRKYLLRVPPSMKTALQAKAWTFGMETKDFILEKET